MSDKNETVQDTIAAALARESGLTAAECKDLQRANGLEWHKIDARYGEIKPGGKERNRVAVSGAAEELAAIEREFEQLKVDLQRNLAQAEALTQRRVRAEAHEACNGLPDLQRALADAVRVAEGAKDALEQALTGLDVASTTVRLARAAAQQAFLPAAGATADTIDRIAALSPWNVTCRHPLLDPRHLGSLGEMLGVEQDTQEAA